MFWWHLKKIYNIYLNKKIFFVVLAVIDPLISLLKWILDSIFDIKLKNVSTLQMVINCPLHRKTVLAQLQ